MNETDKKIGCSHNCSDQQHHHRSPGDRVDLRCDHRPGVSHHSRQVHHQARARVRLLGRARRAVVLGLVALATALSLALVPSVAQAADYLAPPASTDALPWQSLPHCADMSTNGASVEAGTLPAVGLGWGPGKPSVLVYPGSYAVQFAPMMPCLDPSNNSFSVYVYTNVISGDPPYGYVIANWALSFTCLDPTGAVVVSSKVGSIGVGAPGQAVNAGEYPDIRAPACSQIVKVTMMMCSGAFKCNGATPTMNAVWVPRQWNTADSGFTPATSPTQILGAGTELPIRCVIDNSGADIVAVTQNVVASIVNWFPCMFIPVGWDRAGMIPNAWSVGPMGQLVSAYKAAVPGGIACGAVGSIPFFGTVIAFDTCRADFAPGFVKSVLSYVLILGVCVLIVRRIMWSVGSKG